GERAFVAERFPQQARIASLDPGADAGRRRDIERRSLHANGPQGLQPDLVGRFRHRAPESLLDVRPERVEGLSGKVVCHRRATIPPPAEADSGPLANPARKIRRLSEFDPPRAAGPPYTATLDEAHLPAEEAKAGQDPRVSGQDAYPRWAG